MYSVYFLCWAVFGFLPGLACGWLFKNKIAAYVFGILLGGAIGAASPWAILFVLSQFTEEVRSPVGSSLWMICATRGLFYAIVAAVLGVQAVIQQRKKRK